MMNYNNLSDSDGAVGIVHNHNQQTISGGVVLPKCRYYVKGICRFGETCRFAHDTFNTNDGPSTSGACAVPNITSNDRWVMAPIFVPQGKKVLTTIMQPSITPTTTTSSSLLTTTIIPTTTTPNNAVIFHTNLPMTNNINGISKSYAQVVGCSLDSNQQNTLRTLMNNYTRIMCPYIIRNDGRCPYKEYCVYDHGDQCELCGFYCLHPTDMEQRRKHNFDCIRQHEKDMEISFAKQRSKDKTCGVCFEIIMEKLGREKRFGILPNCNHVFCLQCIRKWRQAKQFDYNIIRACPECRVTSDFVCPSIFWVDTKEEKDKLITDYKNVLGQKDCKYFKQGAGRCPFGNKCFYKHVLPNGAHVDLGVPQRKARHINRLVELDVVQNLEQIFLWEFMEDREQRWIDDIASIFSDSAESDWSEYDILDF